MTGYVEQAPEFETLLPNEHTKILDFLQSKGHTDVAKHLETLINNERS